MTEPQRDDDLRAVDPDLLPPQVRELVKVIGLAETLALLDARRGLPMTLPSRADGPSSLRGVISDEAIARLASSPLAGKHYRDAPTSAKILKQMRDAAIAASGLPLSALAREYRLTRQQVLRIRRLVRDDRQLDLLAQDAIG